MPNNNIEPVESAEPTWRSERELVNYKLDQMKKAAEGDREENREKFKTLFNITDELKQSLAAVKTSLRIQIGLTSAVFLGMIGTLWQLIIG
jgi:hypothetical protein